MSNDQVKEFVRAITRLSDAVCRPGITFDTPSGGKVGDLTEAMCYIAEGLYEIAEAIRDHAED